MELVVRTWNLFHGRTVPETRKAHVEQAVRLVVHDRPDVVCLQEVPLWAVPRLHAWSGMAARGTRTRRALAGPLARMLQRLHAGWARSPVTGQANAILLGDRLELVAFGSRRLNPGVRGERRLVQLAVLRAGERTLALANTHLTAHAPDLARGELVALHDLVGDAGPCLVCGDLNLRSVGLPGFQPPIPGLDQILVRGLHTVRGPEPWPEERRRLGAGLLSDHAPVEAAMIWA